MFEELNRLTGWSPTSLPLNQSILISGRDVDASFLLHHFISMYLKAGEAVLLVTAAQSEPHYSVVCGKFSVNFDKCKQANKLSVVNLLDISLSDYLQDSGECGTGDEASFHGYFEKGIAQSLFTKIKAEIERFSSEDKVLVVFDDITVLSNIGVDVGAVSNFTRSMRLLCESKPCAFLAQLNLNGFAAVDDTLYPNCRIPCTCEFQIEGLETGYSKDVHGQICFILKGEDSMVNAPKKITRQYKLSDRALNLFAAGMSRAVL